MGEKIKKLIHKLRKSFMDKEQKVFFPFSISEAKKMILSDYEDQSSDYRWEVETKEEVSVLERFMKADDIICDFGIGIGRVSAEILKNFPGVSIIGVDGSRQMLKQCKEFIPGDHHNRLQLFHFDQLEEIKDDSVDLAYSLYVLQHISRDNFRRAVEELKRIIKPDGMLYLLNAYGRCVFDNENAAGYDDGLDQLKIISEYFSESEDIKYESDYMKEILKVHFSKMFVPRK